MTIMEHVNGTQRGRTPSPLPEHTFQDSGITIKIRKIGPMTQQRLSQAIQKEMPEPEPPRNPPDSEAAQMGEEFNRADPAFERAMKEWQQKAAIELNNRMLKLAALEAEVTIDASARADIARKRRNLELTDVAYQDDPRLSEEENERVFFILYVACATTDDLKEFGQVVTTRSMPTEEAVQRHVATFSGDVPTA